MRGKKMVFTGCQKFENELPINENIITRDFIVEK